MTSEKLGDQPEPSPARPHDEARQNVLFWLGCSAAYGALVCLYWPSLDHPPLSLDDQSQLAAAAGQSVSELWSRDHFGHFRPLKNLLFWLVSRTEPSSTWRAAILLLFTATVAAVQLFAAQLSRSRWLGLAVVVCWALHPTTTTVVCWLSASNAVLALLAMLVYLLLSDLSHTSLLSTPRRRLFRVLAAAALAIGLLSHELALLSPLLLFFLQRLRRPAKRDRKLYAGSIAVFVVYAVASVTASGSVSAPYRFESETPRWLMSLSAARYLGENALLWLWPSGRFGVLLSDDPSAHLVESGVWWVGLLLAGYALWKHRRRDPVLTFALLWSVVTLAFLSNFIPLGNTPVAVHYLFIPGVGFAIAASRVFALLAARSAPTQESRQALLVVAVVVLLGGFWGYESSSVVAAWENEERLYRATLHNYPDNVEALVNLSSFYLGLGRDADAGVLLEQARRLAPGDLNVVRNSYALLARAEQPQAALELLAQHPELMERSEFLIRQGEALQQLKRFGEAKQAFEKALERADPSRQPAEWCAAGYGLAIAQLQTGVAPKQVGVLVERLCGRCSTPALTELRGLLR